MVVNEEHTRSVVTDLADVLGAELAFELQQHPAEAEEHVQAIGLFQRAVQDRIEVLEDVRDARQLRRHRNLVLMEVAHLRAKVTLRIF